MKGTFIAIDEHGMKKNPDPLSIGAIRRKRTSSGDYVEVTCASLNCEYTENFLICSN